MRLFGIHGPILEVHPRDFKRGDFVQENLLAPQNESSSWLEVWDVGPGRLVGAEVSRFVRLSYAGWVDYRNGTYPVQRPKHVIETRIYVFPDGHDASESVWEPDRTPHNGEADL